MQIRTDENGREIKSHGTYAFPVLVSHEALSNYERRSFLWHWHGELEWTYIEEGEICYQVNDCVYHLKKGQGLLCNSNVLHMGKAENDQDCRYVSITVHPRLFGGFENSFLEKQYVEPVLDHVAYTHVVLDREPWQQEILQRLRQVEQLDWQKPDHYEFQIYLLLMENWMTVWQNAWAHPEQAGQDSTESLNMLRLKVIFSYLHQHYAEKITLQDVARQVNLCEAEICRLFKRYMKESLFDYLLDYRVEQSTAVLLEANVTEAAERSGFSSPAYYTKVFKERMGCSPREYARSLKNRTCMDGTVN